MELEINLGSNRNVTMIQMRDKCKCIFLRNTERAGWTHGCLGVGCNFIFLRPADIKLSPNKHLLILTTCTNWEPTCYKNRFLPTMEWRWSLKILTITITITITIWQDQSLATMVFQWFFQFWGPMVHDGYMAVSEQKDSILV